jgi:hypothetical protein
MSATIEMASFLNELLSSAVQLPATVQAKAEALKAQAEAAIAAYDAWIDEQAAMRDDAKAMFIPGGAY